MRPLIGEYDCKLDQKGRFLLPAALRKQLPVEEQTHFVLSRGIDTCLVLRPLKIWEKKLEEVFSKSEFIDDHRDFGRAFTKGATPIELDSHSRVLIPKRLKAYAKLEKEIILIAQYDKVEIWDTQAYDAWQEGLEALSSLAERVMGKESSAEEELGLD